MATNQSTPEGLKKLEEQITCPICLEHFTNPKILPCFHSSCLHCLQGVPIVLVDGNHSLPCPTCRSSCPVPDNGLASLPSSFIINNFMEAYKLMKKESTYQHASCDNCNSINANSCCKQCRKLFCSECFPHHNIGKVKCTTFLPWPAKMNFSRQCIFLIKKESNVTIAFFLPNGSPAPIPPFLISCHLTAPDNSPPIQYSVKESSQSGQYNVVFTPLIRGLHQLHVTVNNTNIQGSPVTVPVTVPPEMKGTLVKTITGLKGPSGVAVTDDGLVIVSECEGHCITILDREGKKIRSFGSLGNGRGQLHFPQGVAVTSKRTLLVSDCKNHRMQEFTMEGDYISCVGTVGNGPLQFYCPCGIAINKKTGQVIVVDNGNHRIQVLHPDLTFSHMFGSEGSGQGQLRYPQDVTIDSQGFLYITDSYNFCIRKFTPEGQFVLSFGIRGSKAGQLCKPSGITVDDSDLLYVNSRNDFVSIYTTIGQFVSCIAKNVVNSIFHTGICGAKLDTNGDLYICCPTSNKIQVY